MPADEKPAFDIQKIGEQIGELIKFMRHMNKKMDKVVTKFGVYSVINGANGHPIGAECDEAVKSLVDEFGSKAVIEHATYTKDHLLD